MYPDKIIALVPPPQGLASQVFLMELKTVISYLLIVIRPMNQITGTRMYIITATPISGLNTLAGCLRLLGFNTPTSPHDPATINNFNIAMHG